jgi:hypothetical protein
MAASPDLDLEPDELVHTFAFADDGRVSPFGRIFGVAPRNSRVEIDGSTLRATFGPWRVATPLANVEHVEVQGPYHWAKVAGPARYSMKDHSLTFATTVRRGVAISFTEPIRGLDPLGVYRHPSLTVTVEDPETFAATLRSAIEHVDEIERDEHDHLAGMTAKELRELGRRHGLEGVSGLKKDELVEALSELEG